MIQRHSVCVEKGEPCRTALPHLMRITARTVPATACPGRPKDLVELEKDRGRAGFRSRTRAGKTDLIKRRVESRPRGPAGEEIPEDGEQLPPSRAEATEGTAGPVCAAGAPAGADRPGR